MKKKKIVMVWHKYVESVIGGIAVTCLLLLSACTAVKPETQNQDMLAAAENAVENILAAPILEANIEGIETPAFLSTIEARNGYEILSFETNEDGAVATMRVYAPDVYNAVKDLDASQTYTATDELLIALDDAMKNAPIVDREVILHYVLTDEGYTPVLTSDFLDAYYGGFYRLRDEFITDALSEAEGS